MNYTANHFSLSLPSGEGQGDIPNLLRHLANALEKEKSVSILDIVFHSEIDDQGDEWPSFTVYYGKTGESD